MSVKPLFNLQKYLIVLPTLLGCLSITASGAESSSAKSSRAKSSSAEKSKLEQQRLSLKQPAVLQDLAYGNILFDYYRGKPLAALNSILIAEKKQLLPNHKQSARLLSGAIYLDMGMLDHAQTIFDYLLTESHLKDELLAKLEFYLGKLHYRQGDFSAAKQRLEKVVTQLEQRLKDEGLLMLGNIALAKDQKEVARQWLLQVSENSPLIHFSRYNLGMAWLRDGQESKAIPLLANLFLNSADNQLATNAGDVKNNLQDKAYVALGYYFLAKKDIALAQSYLTRVNLNSSQTNKALLGMGWSYIEQKQYTKALAHWQALVDKDPRDIAVQEAKLAIAYAYQNANALQQSLDAYLAASASYQQQLSMLEQLLLQVNRGELFEKTFAQIDQQNRLQSKNKLSLQSEVEDSQLLGKDYDYYLYEIMAEHQFNENFKNYQNLFQLTQMVEHWEQKLPIFDEIINTNKKRFEQQLPLVEAYLQGNEFTEFSLKLNNLKNTIASLKQNKDLYLLANSEQQKSYNRIQNLNSTIEKLPVDKLSDTQRLTAKRAQGILQWQLESGKRAKIWPLEKTAMQIQSTLSEMNARKKSLGSARQIAAKRYGNYQQQVDNNRRNLLGLNDKIADHMTVQLNQLKQQVINTLNQRIKSLDTLLLQADLSVARLQSQAVMLNGVGVNADSNLEADLEAKQDVDNEAN
jgi:hypothetical protein